MASHSSYIPSSCRGQQPSPFNSQHSSSYSNESNYRGSFRAPDELPREDHHSNMAADAEASIKGDLANPAMRSDIADWLYMTQWHDAAIRSDKLSKHRRLAEIDRQQDMLNRQRSELLENHQQHIAPSAAFQTQDDKQDTSGHGYSKTDAYGGRHGDYNRSRSVYPSRSRSRSRERRHSSSRCDRRYDDHEGYRDHKEAISRNGHRHYREREYVADDRPSNSFYRDIKGSQSQHHSDHQGHGRRHLDRHSIPHRDQNRLETPAEIARQLDVDQGKRRDEAREAPHLEYPLHIDLGDSLNDTRFFIMRSYTYTHIYDCQDEGLWATQTSNEKRLRQAFEETLNVILFFSKNRSHAFQGYAKMLSAPTDDPEVRPRWYNGVKWPLSRPFRVQWINKVHCDDHNVKNLRNAYNEDLGPNRAKDGQEVDPATGKAMTQILDREAVSVVNHCDGLGSGGQNGEKDDTKE